MPQGFTGNPEKMTKHKQKKKKNDYVCTLLKTKCHE
jgi:hypothetical protein